MPSIKPTPLASGALHSSPSTSDATARPRRIRAFVLAAAVLVALFSVPLFQLVKLALKSEIQSHILLIPFISLYLWKTGRPAASPGRSPPPSLYLACFPALAGLAPLAAYWFWGSSGRMVRSDALALLTLSFLLFLLAAALATLGRHTLRSHRFAIAFLVFMIPLPLALTDFMSVMLQRASAEAADWMLSLTGMPAFRQGMTFQFAGLAIRVAEECSGVRSTFVLFITSLLAGHLFLRTGWKKALLALAIFPLGILRNGFRVTVISWLTVNVDAGIIDGPLHHRGGPLFFALSLVPLFGLLWILRRSDLPKQQH